MDDPQDFGLFGVKEDGLGIHVPSSDHRVISHEVLFEDDVTTLKDRPIFLGFSLSKIRFFAAIGVVLVVVSVLVGQAFSMQVLQGASFKLKADQNRLRHVVDAARRGIIRDRNGIVLAENIPSFELQVTPAALPTDEQSRDELLASVGKEVNMGLDELRATIASSTDDNAPLTLVRDLTYNQAIALSIQTGPDSALQVVTGNKRRYPYSKDVESLSHVLGYVGPISREVLQASNGAYKQTDSVGKTGIEASYEDRLRGTAGEQVYEVDSTNHVRSLVQNTAPTDGADVQLTLDYSLQKAAEAALKKELAAIHLSRGAAVAIDPRDGSILALVSLPAYDDNDFSGRVSSTVYQALIQDPEHPLLPRAWAGTYPSGSTIKSVVSTAALSEHIITPNTTVNSVGGIHVGATFFPDWKAGGHGITNVRRAIAWSVNTFFYYVGGGYQNFIGLGVDRLTAWMRKFGLGAKTGLDLPGEAAGFVPSQAWKRETKGEPWYIGDTYNLSIGQGDLLVTPLQDALMTAEVANGGYRLRPHLVATGPTSSYVSSTPLADPADVETVRLGMRDTVVYGSGRRLSELPFPVAGKTGTAQWRNDRPNHAWFTAFAPFDKPEIVVTVLIEEGVEGSSTAVPVTEDILKAWYAERQHGAPIVDTATSTR